MNGRVDGRMDGLMDQKKRIFCIMIHALGLLKLR